MSQISKNLYKKLQKQYSRRINLDLKRIKKVLQKLNNPQNQVDNVINIIGSDGKNSVLTSLKYFLEANKEKVNAFTSPHLYDVRQRFWLGDRFITFCQQKILMIHLLILLKVDFFSKKIVQIFGNFLWLKLLQI